MTDPKSPEVAAAEPAAQPERIRNRCPSCGFDTLFIGGGGWLVCSWLECKNPGAAGDALLAALRVDPKAETPATLEVIVNGMPVQVTPGPIRQVVTEAIRVSGQIGAPIDQWVLKTRDGEVIPHQLPCGLDYALVGGQRVFMHLDVPLPAAAERQGIAPPPDVRPCGHVAIHPQRCPQCQHEWMQAYCSRDEETCPQCGHIFQRAARQEIPPAATWADLPTDVDTLRRLRERVDAALDEKYTRVAEARHRCADCGAALNAGEAKCFTVCDACWAKAYPPSGAAERSPAPTWQTIDSAPKDGRWFLGWNSDCGCFVWRDGPGLITGEDPAPTHWMPLPSPPSAGSEASKT